MGPAHVAGSLSITFAVRSGDEEGVPALEFPLHAAATIPASSRLEIKT